MTFASPAMFSTAVVIPAVVVWYIAAGRRRARRADALSREGLVATAVPRGLRGGRRRHVPFALFVAALSVLVVALARPMATVRTPRQQGTAIVALDVSNSMRATDVKPSRIEVAKSVASAFVRRQPPAVRVGVVAFGDGATLVQTPTAARPEVLAAIDHVSIGGATSVGQGLLAALNAIAGKTITVDEEALQNDSGSVDVGYYGGTAILVISDGENTSGVDPAAVAKVASVAGVRVHTIGAGTPAGTTLRVGGFDIATALNADLLREIAKATDGTYHATTDAGALAAIGKAIRLHFRIVAHHSEITGVFCALAAALLLLGALMSVVSSGRIVA
jgi:Ca-activated chloride channel family protein